MRLLTQGVAMARLSLTGSRIRQRRMLLGLRQAELARRLQVSASYLNLIEHNRRRVAPDLLDRLAKELGVSRESLSEGADAALIEALRDAAAAVEKDAEPLPELDRIEELVGRFPGWAALMAAQQSRLDALERTVERLTDRMTHEPHLQASLHEVLSVAASLRSTAAILAENDAIDPEWQMRFHRNLHADSLRLAEGAQALVSYLETSQDDETAIAAPQEELESWLEARNYHIPELESGQDVRPEALIAGDSTLASPSARRLALDWLERYRRDALALPLTTMQGALDEHGPDPARLSGVPGLGDDLPRLLRRLASLTAEQLSGPELGLVICDGSGTMTFRKPLPGFRLPRFGAACPLWPLFRALSRPLEPIHARLEMAGRLPQRFDSYSYCHSRTPPSFATPRVLEAYMLLRAADPPEAGAGKGPLAQPERVGTSCRVCPRMDCPARREPSILTQGF